MYLRAANDNEEARGRAACVAQRIEELEKVAPEDIRARLDLAHIYYWQCKLPETLHLVEPLTTAEFPDDIVLEARQLLADSLFRHDRYDEADQRYTENLRMAEQTGSDYWIARAKDGLGWVLVDTGHRYSGEFNNGREAFDATLEIYRKLGNRRGEAMAIFGLSRAIAGAGDYDTAIDYAHQAIAMLQEIGAQDHLQMPYHQLGMVFRDYGTFERSITYFEQAMDAADHAQDPRMQVDICLAYGILLKWMGRGEEAREWWLKAQPTIEELDFPRFGHETNRWLANYAAETDRFEEAYTCLSAANDYGTRIGMVSGTLRHQHMVLRKELDRYVYMADSLMYLNAGVEASLDGIFVLSHQLASIEKGSFALRFINAAAAAMLGRPPVEILHVPISEVWRTHSAQFLLALSREVYASGGARSMNPVQLQFPGLRDRWYSVTVAKIQDGVVWTISDVTEREAMQREIVAQRDRLVALDREKSEMLAMAAHDLRSPIANIYSICELIPTEDPITRKWVALIKSSSQSLLALIGNLLDINRIERGEVSVHVGPVEIIAILDRVVGESFARAAQKQIELRLKMSAPSILALTDESALLQVMENLVSNALKFSSPGTAVEVRAVVRRGYARIEVEDQGPGISTDDQKKLFGKFSRLTARPTAGETSTGLGLSIVKRLVEAMEGDVGVMSEPGGGATFWLELNLAPSQAPNSTL